MLEENSITEENKNRYIYKLTLESGKTYIGQRTYKSNESAITDNYRGSSVYMKEHKEDKIVKREILIENIKDQETLNFLETWCILSEKAYNRENNVNGTLGGFIYRYTRDFKFKKKTQEQIKEQVNSFLKKNGVLIRNLTTNEVKYECEWQNLGFHGSTKDVYYSKKNYFCREEFFKNQNLTPNELIEQYNSRKGKHLKSYYPPRKPCEKRTESLRKVWLNSSDEQRKNRIKGLINKETRRLAQNKIKGKAKDRKSRFEWLGKISKWVVVNDIIYLSLNEASEKINCSDGTLKHFLDGKPSRLKIEGFYFPMELKSLYLEHNCPVKYSDFIKLISD